MAKRIPIEGYGQVELNQVAFRRDGRIEAQCRIADGIDYIENGMILAVNHTARTVGYPTTGDKFLALNYTTEHMYDERLVGGLKHFKLDKDTFLPRLGYLATGDKFTTNCISTENGTEEEAKVATYGHASADGSILVNTTAADAIVKVVKATTMPDGQFALQFVAL